MTPSSLVFYKENGQLLEWTLTDFLHRDQFINDATVVATLYRARNIAVGHVGTPVDFLSDLTLTFVADGLYRGEIPAEFNPNVGVNYILVVDATAPGYRGQHWEILSVVTVRI